MEDQYEREGGDITASDMIVPADDSDIVEFYKNSTIFLTGGTGFLGKLCIEKLLRACPDLNKIYILVRPKRGKDIQKRFDELFDEPSFDPLKRKFPDFYNKIHVVNGDVSQPNLGLCDEDIDMLQAEVDVVMHFAATVKFDEKIKMATNLNVRAVRDALRLSRGMKKLRAFLHVSTAFSNCVRDEIDEQFYEPPITGEKLITLVDTLDDKMLDDMTPILLGDFPNTYAFTKCVAEDVVRTEGKNLPVALYRPSIVIGTVREPVAGWINNVYGATGVLLGVALGLLRILNGNPNNRADMVPADYVINSCLACTWDVATIKTMNENKETQDENSREEKFDKEIPVYNFVSGPEKPLTWKTFRELSTKHCLQIPSEKCVWHSVFVMTPNKFLHTILVFLLHTLPAYFIDCVAFCIRKKPGLVRGYQKINKFAEIISYFSLRQWDFKNDNIQDLWTRLKKQDKERFEFSMRSLDWDLYFYTYTRGGRVYIVKDTLDTIAKGRIKYYKLFVAHYCVCAVVGFLLYKLGAFLFSFVF